MAVDEQGVLAAVAGLQLGYDVLDVPVVMGEAVGELQVERPPRLLEVDADLVDGLGPLLDQGQLLPNEVHGQDLVLVASCCREKFATQLLFPKQLFDRFSLFTQIFCLMGSEILHRAKGGP